MKLPSTPYSKLGLWSPKAQWKHWRWNKPRPLSSTTLRMVASGSVTSLFEMVRAIRCANSSLSQQQILIWNLLVWVCTFKLLCRFRHQAQCGALIPTFGVLKGAPWTMSKEFPIDSRTHCHSKQSQNFYGSSQHRVGGMFMGGENVAIVIPSATSLEW